MNKGLCKAFIRRWVNDDYRIYCDGPSASIGVEMEDNHYSMFTFDWTSKKWGWRQFDTEESLATEMCDYCQNWQTNWHKVDSL